MILSSKQLQSMITEAVKKVLSENGMLITEANNNLSFPDFLKDCRKLGFKVEDTKDGVQISYNGIVLNCTHTKHGASKENKADTLRDIVKKLAEIGYFMNKENADNFPWQRWGFKKDAYVNTMRYNEEEEINTANETYKDAQVWPVFTTKNSVCVIRRSQQPEYNLCRSPKDRRPLLDRWYLDYSNLRCNPNVMALKIDNEEVIRTEAYPINPDGTLGDMIEETINHNNKSLC